MLAVILVALAKLGGAPCERLGQPAVLGELGAGLVLGNLALVGGPDLRGLLDSEALLLLAEMGAVLLLFKVGLESTSQEMLAVGGRAFVVACAGVVAPMVLGFGVGALMHPDESLDAARVPRRHARRHQRRHHRARAGGPRRRSTRRPPRIILGAAVIDDVLGLIVLAVVSGIITAAATGVALAPAAVLWIVGKAVLFLVGAVWSSARSLAPRLFRRRWPLPAGDVCGALALAPAASLCSYLAALAGLAPIVGAFAAGLVLRREARRRARRARRAAARAGARTAGRVPGARSSSCGWACWWTCRRSRRGPCSPSRWCLTLAAVVGQAGVRPLRARRACRASSSASA